MTDWPDLVVAATVGAASRPVDLLATPPAVAEVAPPSTDPAGSLLDAAVAFTVAARAGRRPARGVVPEPAPVDPRPVVSPLAAELLRVVLVDRELGLAGSALTQIAAAGRRLPDQLVPTVLALGARHGVLRPGVLAACGPVAPWLARRNPVWAWASGAGSTPAVGPFDATAFDTGDPAERLTQLRALRATDPAAASTLLRGAWPTTSPDERADLLATLGPVPLPADEPLLEATLDDRRAAVRDIAVGLLARLDGSAFRGRAAARVGGLLRVERRGLRRAVVVDAPPEFDAAAVRDGLPRSSPAATRAVAASAGAGVVGPAAIRVHALVTAAPLAAWEPATGLRPEQLVGLALDRFADEVLAGWIVATRRERDVRWAVALLDHADRTRPPVRAGVAALLALLPPADRDRRLVAALGAPRTGPDVSVLRVAATPWSDALATAVGRWVRAAARHPPGRELIGPLELCGRGLPATAGSAEALRGIADGAPDGAVWMRAARAAADTLDLRRRLTEELR